MKKDEKKSIKKELKRTKKINVNYHWILQITIISFIISIIFSMLSEMIVPNVNIIIGILILIIFILIGIIFDMIGVAVQSADVVPFHSMNSRRVKGADVAVNFKKNADKTSSFCNDVVGDICGIISGSASSIIATKLALSFNLNSVVVILIITGITSAFTIGGKAIGKSVAINKSNYILYEFSKIASHFYKVKK
jgi:CBS domain containing-hemolysin-like protein